MPHRWWIGTLVLFFLAAHFPFLDSPFVNLEYAYAESAQLISQGQVSQATRSLDRAIANPLGTSAAVSLFYLVFGAGERVSRLLPLFCGTALILTTFLALSHSPFYSAHRTDAQAVIAAAFVGFHPLLWVYSGVLGSDIPFIFFITASVCLTLAANRKDSTSLHFLSALFISAAALIKYSAIAFVPILIAIIAVETHAGRYSPHDLIKTLLMYAFTGGVVVSVYLAYITSTLGHVISQEQANHLGLFPAWNNLRHIPPRLAAYFVWMGLFSGPFIFVPIWCVLHRFQFQKRIYGGISLFVAACAGAYLVVNDSAENPDLSEMRLGWIRHFVTGKPALWVANTFLLFIGGIAVIALFVWCKENWRERYIHMTWITSFFAFHTFSRPSLRYMVFILPPIAAFVADSLMPSTDSKTRLAYTTTVVLLGCLLFACVSLFSSAYFAEEGRAAALVAEFVNKNHIRIPSEGEVQPHCLYLIEKQNVVETESDTQYQLISLERNELRAGVLFEAPVTVAGILMRRFAVATQ